MKWHAKLVYDDPKPGTVRLRRRFAWWPTRIKNEFIWLGCFEVLEVFIKFEHKVVDLEAKKEYVFVVLEWVDTEKRLIIESSGV